MPESLIPSDPLPGSFWQQLSRREFKQVVAALEHPDFRFFLGGSFLSNIGSWMQTVAQAWLVLQITNSPFYLGLDGFAGTLPIALFAFWGGVIADRVDRRRMLMVTQWVLLSLAFVLAILTQMHWVRVWEVIAFSFCTGLTQAISWPVYQSTMANIVRREHLSNAIALNSTQFNIARMIGPVVGALALSRFGTAGCFYANAISFFAVILALRRVHVPTNRRAGTLVPSGFLQSFREGFGYLDDKRALFWLLLLLSVASLLGIPMVTLLPLYARDILKIGASGYGVLVGAFGAGAVISGILVAFLGDFHGKGKFVLSAVYLFVVGMVGFSLSKNLLVSVSCLFLCGFSMVGFASVTNTIIQADVPDELRGRAMSLFVFSFGGCMPLGNLLSGYLAKVFTAPVSLSAEGLLLAGFAVFMTLRHPEVRTIG